MGTIPELTTTTPNQITFTRLPMSTLPIEPSEQDLLNAEFIESIEKRASELEVTVDYYLEEFLLA